jgi:hypothetical protein
MNSKEMKNHLRHDLKHARLPLTTQQDGIGFRLKQEN